jgi:hypothetical protein
VIISYWGGAQGLFFLLFGEEEVRCHDGAGGWLRVGRADAIVVKDTVQISICKTSCERPCAHHIIARLSQNNYESYL